MRRLAGAWADAEPAEDTRVGERLLETPPSEIGIPAIVLYELELGALQSNAPRRRHEQLQDLLEAVTLMPFGLAEAKAAARLQAELELEGRASARTIR